MNNIFTLDGNYTDYSMQFTERKLIFVINMMRYEE